MKSPCLGSASAQNSVAAGDSTQHSSRHAQPRSGYELYTPPHPASYNMDPAVSCTCIPSDCRNAWPALMGVVYERSKSEKRSAVCRGWSCQATTLKPPRGLAPQGLSASILQPLVPKSLMTFTLSKPALRKGISTVLSRIVLVCLFPAGRPTILLLHTGPAETVGRVIARRQPQCHHTSLAHTTRSLMARRRRKCQRISLKPAVAGLRASTHRQARRNRTRPADMACRARSRPERQHINPAVFRPTARRQRRRQCTCLSECLTGSISHTGLRQRQSWPPLVCSPMQQSYPADRMHCHLPCFGSVKSAILP